MTKLLTTGEMIDTLKVGEVAETYGGFKVMKHNGGSITWIHDGDDPHNYLKINMVALDFKWRILPYYVSFNAAMKALKEGKPVALHRYSMPEKTIFRHWYKLETRNDLTFSDLFNGDWTIEGDNQ